MVRLDALSYCAFEEVDDVMGECDRFDVHRSMKVGFVGGYGVVVEEGLDEAHGMCGCQPFASVTIMVADVSSVGTGTRDVTPMACFIHRPHNSYALAWACDWDCVIVIIVFVFGEWVVTNILG